MSASKQHAKFCISIQVEKNIWKQGGDGIPMQEALKKVGPNTFAPSPPLCHFLTMPCGACYVSTARFLFDWKCFRQLRPYNLIKRVSSRVSNTVRAVIGLQLTQRVRYLRAGDTHACLTGRHYPQMYEYCDRCYNSDQSALHRVSTHCQSTTTLQPECWNRFSKRRANYDIGHSK